MSSKVVRIVVIILAAALVLAGLKFTSIGVGPGHTRQDDGYNVTGGFMSLAGGFILGKVWNERGRQKNGTAKKRS